MHFLGIVAAVAIGIALVRGADFLLRAFGLLIWLTAVAVAFG